MLVERNSLEKKDSLRWHSNHIINYIYIHTTIHQNWIHAHKKNHTHIHTDKTNRRHRHRLRGRDNNKIMRHKSRRRRKHGLGRGIEHFLSTYFLEAQMNWRELKPCQTDDDISNESYANEWHRSGADEVAFEEPTGAARYFFFNNYYIPDDGQSACRPAHKKQGSATDKPWIPPSSSPRPFYLFISLFFFSLTKTLGSKCLSTCICKLVLSCTLWPVQCLCFPLQIII